MFIGYVINLNSRTDRLHKFNLHPDAKYFERVAAIDKEILKLVSDGEKDIFFDSQYIRDVYRRDVTLGEIACTLSHIKCWKKIVNNPSISEDDFAVIAEDDVVLCEDFLANIQKLQENLKQASGINIVIMQMLFYENLPALSLAKGEVEQYSFLSSNDKNAFMNSGSALYLIRKCYAREVLLYLEKKKPNWLADEFRQFCEPQSIRIASPLLGMVSGGINAESDLEQERQNARKSGI
ncbi:udp-glcnac--lipooligosaccharide n-acetylglucosaminyl glycosyltransferase [Actinobacillus porcitonsillarum]|uniref:Udp-glcnac--lipooligosaccharide n-acetylglucosaminyl glycosyltransferase n=1 Tax=Actinobacillus porcitonsillarum TaxID=189834 RepID=A0A2U8FLT5_9PAST|nr:glycosyltransferase family 25 protein [Actinobacillus porcitonsillarum]AWI51903.1 udp-glcnac--lipooligosaccharide n-acetylglucosaminyl glycosyltransferase [Actinobacillus porcitonsillarum]